MSEIRWYRSLYWRIAFGLFAFVALMLVAQGVLFVWIFNQTAGSMPARSPGRLAGLIGSELTGALATDRDLDIAEYVREQYGHVFQPLVVVMRHRAPVANHEELPPELRDAIDLEEARLRVPESPGEGRRGPGRGVGPRSGRAWESAPIFLDGQQVGRVAVLARFPTERFISELGPLMLAAVVGVLAVGITLIALLVFGPARRRLRAVQSAAEQLGAGVTTARAPEQGGDEVAAVAQSFNRMADELERRASALEAADRTRRQLLADVSHELMTPLTAMRGYLETLTMSGVALTAETRVRYLSIVETETHRLERLVGDLLDVAKLESAGVTLRQEPVSLPAVFERVRQRHERDATAHHITLASHIASGADIVAGDADRIEQALQNLVANALRHTPEGGTISLFAEPAGENTIRISVRDNGPGIPDEHLLHIFDRFYKVDSSRRATGGSGLGLSIVKAIVERHGGSISARNDDGGVFEITLPRQA